MHNLNTYFKYVFFLLMGGIFLNACVSSSQDKEEQQENPVDEYVRDPHSFSRPEEAKVKHLSLNLNVDFKQKVLEGYALLDLALEGEAKKLLLDTKALDIQAVLNQKGDSLSYQLHEEIEWMGSALEVDLNDSTQQVYVYYQTSPSSEALQWLAPAQTAGKKQPFLFTQSQAILARSWVPIQDSPGIRFTYDATIKVPAHLLALMSAENPQKKNAEGVYHFTMDKPIPAYLLALTVGDIRFKNVGERTGVYAEPVVLNEAADELSEMDSLLFAAEKLYGNYQWGRYDVIILPPSFPFGGMENPKLTFATPTILAGDKSLVSLIAHELAHSWSGNLATNATWNDFWLNEGFTVYFELRIMEEVYGKDFADMLALISYRDLQLDLEFLEYGDDTKLKLNLAGRNPDDGMNSIAYDKGFHLLKLIEKNVGRAQFDEFLNQYFQNFAFKSVTTEQFLKYLDEHLLKDHQEAKDSIQVNRWVYDAGLPANCPRTESMRFTTAVSKAQLFFEGIPADSLEAKEDFQYYQEWEFFLDYLPDDLGVEKMAELDRTFNFTKSNNSEILFQWLKHVVSNEYTPAYPKLEQFLTNVGRRKFIVPIYRLMMEKESTQARARRIYQKARKNYHFVAVETLDEIILEDKQ